MQGKINCTKYVHIQHYSDAHIYVNKYLSYIVLHNSTWGTEKQHYDVENHLWPDQVEWVTCQSWSKVSFGYM